MKRREFFAALCGAVCLPVIAGKIQQRLVSSYHGNSLSISLNEARVAADRLADSIELDIAKTTRMYLLTEDGREILLGTVKELHVY